MSRDKSTIRHHGVTAVQLPVGVIHPECRTDREMLLTARFHSTPQMGPCDRCGNTLMHPPPKRVCGGCLSIWIEPGELPVERRGVCPHCNPGRALGILVQRGKGPVAGPT